ncbi:nucleotide disphospho-sugar-binding domain-containing protein [Dactylosporangium siamense]|uniref:Glycosyl transferase n=1 Tax=Dactylosporangium siamense TaxID=685454 RepID=A0A919U4Z3_9ACTN|nr:nucleotide disphospho-sugar-binding domain-containing protein [Dactylosporangium siamense]GIG42684.1 glycosyl transferase [Dactylosporangium siamense]
MRVLFVSAPLLGHVLPLVPLAEAFRRAGHEVLVATAADALTAGRAVKLPVADVAPGFSFGRTARRMMLRHPLIARAELAGTAGTRGVALLFGAVNERLVDGVAAVTDRFRPDLVVHEPLAVAGAVAAARRGIPAVRHENNLFDGAVLAAVTAGPALRRHRVEALPEPLTAVQIAPPELVGERTGTPMRHLPGTVGGTATPFPVREGRPRIAVSRSTVDGPGSGGLMRAVVAVAGEVDADILLVRPERGLPADLPRNVFTAGWVPLDALLPTVGAVVHHGGAGTVLGALAAGVPQLVVPGPGDRRHNAGVVERSGAGWAMSATAITADQLHRLLSDYGLRMTAGRFRASIAARPHPDSVAAQLAAIG